MQHSKLLDEIFKLVVITPGYDPLGITRYTET